ncbi:GtrA family protein [Loktanella sp. Alg231-35]|uniref:GtrA family protein n=1 Tax=Loktanella sp. Alg231-35 TaxID=1922220 RepID=UPI00131F43DE|nr:GtrA family protein [Loktanella sp. Alg231-35]
MKRDKAAQTTYESLRFGIVSIIGLCVDIALTWLVFASFGVSLLVSAAIGFAAGACLNYALHEFWTFKRTESRVSIQRLTRYAIALVATLTARLCAVFVFSRVMDEVQYALLILILATGISFVMTYLISKLFVFKSEGSSETTHKGNTL